MPKYFVITSGSHITLCLGKLSFLLKVPLSNLIIRGCVPTGFLSQTVKVDRALLAVFITLHPSPTSKGESKISSTVSRFGDRLYKLCTVFESLISKVPGEGAWRCHLSSKC